MPEKDRSCIRVYDIGNPRDSFIRRIARLCWLDVLENKFPVSPDKADELAVSVKEIYKRIDEKFGTFHIVMTQSDYDIMSTLLFRSLSDDSN